AGSTAWDSVPLGPFTVTRFLSLMVISTPLGRPIGAFPMRDMASSARGVLAHITEHLAAHVQGTGLLVGDHAAAGADDGHAQAVEHAGQLTGGGVLAQTGGAHTLELADGALTGTRIVLQGDLDQALLAVLHGLPREDVPLVVKDPRDILLQVARGHLNDLLARLD